MDDGVESIEDGGEKLVDGAEEVVDSAGDGHFCDLSELNSYSADCEIVD